jgi:DSF synthase
MQNYDDLLQRRLRHLKVSHDRSSKAVWVEFKYEKRPCFSRELIEEVWAVQRSIRRAAQSGYQENREDRLLFQVIGSTDKKVFNLGGDLVYFIELIEAGDEEGLRDYANRCIDIQYASVSHYGIPFTSIACVAGEALGGGFEAALSANVLVAEQKARFGFPEITFGMFPGMGALSLLLRKISPAIAHRLIMDHRIYSATELYEMGVVDILAPDGEGRAAVNDYMQRYSSLAPGYHGFQAAVDRVSPVNYEEMRDVVTIWVETALRLSEKNRRLMAYFARAQARRHISPNSMVGEIDIHSA